MSQGSPPAPARQRRLARLLLRAGVIVAGVLLLIAATVLVGLHTSPARRFVLAQVRAVLDARGVEFQATSLDYNLLRLTVSLDDLVVRAATAPDLPPFARADRVYVHLDTLALVRGRYHVRDGAIDGLELHVLTMEDGRNNLPQLPETEAPVEEGGEPIDYLVTAFAVRRAALRYEDRSEAVDVTARVPALDVEGHPLTSRHRIRIAPATASVRQGHRASDLTLHSADLDLGSTDLHVSDLHLESPFAQLRLSGDVTAFAPLALDLAASMEIAVAEAVAFAEVDEPLGGHATVDARIRGPVDALEVAATIEGRDLTARTIEGLRLSAAAVYDGAAQQVTIDAFHVTGPAGDLTARGRVALAAEAGASSLDASFSALDLAALMRAARLDYLVASRVSGELSGSMPGLDYMAGTGSGRLAFQPVGAPSANVIPLAGGVQIDGGANRVTARVTQVRALGVTADGTVTLLDAERLGGTVALAAADLAPVIAATEAFLGGPSGSLVGTSVAGPARINARLGGTVDSPAASVALAAPALTVGDASGLHIDGAVGYTPARIEVQALDVRWEQAFVRATGTVGLEGARPLALDVAADRLSIADLLQAIEQPDVPASGTIGATARIGGTIDAPEGEVLLQVDDLAAYGELWGHITGTAQLEQDAPVAFAVRLDKPQDDAVASLSVRGSYDLATERFEADLASDRLQLAGLTLPDDVPVRGWLELAGQAQGTREAPVAKLRVTAGDLEVAGQDVGDVVAMADVLGGRAHVQVDADRFATRAVADVALADSYPGLVSLIVRDLDLATLPGLADADVTGRLRATVDASGDFAQPESLTAVALVDAIDLIWNGQPVGLDAPASLRYRDERIFIDSLVLRARESLVSVAGDLPIAEDAEPGAIEIDATLDLATLALYAPDEVELSADGVAALQGRVTGTLRAIDPTLMLTLERGALATAGFEPGLTDVELRLEVSEGELRVPELSAALGPARLQAEAHVPLEVLPEDLPVALPRARGEARLSAQLAALDLATLPNAPEELTGTLAMTADLRAARPELEAVTGDIVFQTLDVAFDGLAFAQEAVSRITVGGGVANIDRMTLAGSAGRIDAGGSVALAGDRAVDVDVTGRIELGALTVLADGVQAEGPATLQLAVTGDLDSPLIDGFVDVADARVVNLDPAVALEDLQARIDFSRDRAVLSRFDGLLNGGAFTGSGAVGFGGGTLSDIALAVSVKGMALDVPLDLRSLIDADITVSERGDLIDVGGEIVIQEAGLTRDVTLDRGLLAGVAGPRSLDLTTERNPLLERMRLGIRVTTATPILLDNNLARGEVTADLRVVGTPYETGMTGRLVVEEDSTVTLNERTYVIERGIITFNEERQIVPEFDLQMSTRVSTYDILLAVTGEPGDTDTRLTSDPGLPEPDIIALLVTGRTLDEVRGEEVARAQVLSYVTGVAGGSLGRGLERATGLSRVRLEPNLIAGEADPGARLTIGQDITEALRLIYSNDLVNGGDDIWVAEYDVTRRFQTRAVRQPDASYRFDVRHDVRFGGTPEPRRDRPRERQIVGEVRLDGSTGVDDAEALRRFGVRSGQVYSFFDVRRGTDRVEALLRSQGLLQSRVRVRRTPDNDRVHLSLAVEPGPRVEILYAGVAPPRRLRDAVELVWYRGVFDAQRTTDAERVLLAWLVGRDRVAARIEHVVEDLAPGQRRVTFVIDEGPRYRTVALAFEGTAGIPAEELEAIVNEQRLRSELFTDPVRVTDLLERYYREQGYLTARVGPVQREFSGDLARAIVQVQEGPRFIVRDVQVQGNDALPGPVLLAESLLRPGDPYLPAVAERSQGAMRALYAGRGYNDANVAYVLGVDRDAGTIDLTFAVEEGRRERVIEIVVDGNERTSDRLVARQLTVEPGEPLPLAGLGESRRRLYDTRAFTLVDILRDDLTPPAPAAGEVVPASLLSPPGPVEPAEGEKPVRLRVAVREVQPFQIRYGGFFDTERGPGGIVDFSNHNSLGSARVLGLRTRYDAQLREGRLYLSQPSLRDMPVETTANLFYVQERHPVTAPDTSPLNIDRFGASVQQEARLRDSFVLNYGYRFERQRAWDRDLPRLQDETSRVSPVTGALTRDTRDDLLDASRGQFMSHAVSVSPSFLGADAPYVKYLGQFFTYRPLQPERRERFTGEILRPRLVYAAGIRFGLAGGIGSGQVPVGERFFGGGSTTLRGFGQHTVGPVDQDGGEATIVINNEIRIPLFNRFDGVAFVDVGNVFARVSDLSFDLRRSGGVGLRIRTPWFLGRVDFGMPFDRREGEARSQVFFSIGQAF